MIKVHISFFANAKLILLWIYKQLQYKICLQSLLLLFCILLDHILGVHLTSWCLKQVLGTHTSILGISQSVKMLRLFVWGLAKKRLPFSFAPIKLFLYIYLISKCFLHTCMATSIPKPHQWIITTKCGLYTCGFETLSMLFFTLLLCYNTITETLI